MPKRRSQEKWTNADDGVDIGVDAPSPPMLVFGDEGFKITGVY
jgi:hypothetical protein